MDVGFEDWFSWVLKGAKGAQIFPGPRPSRLGMSNPRNVKFKAARARVFSEVPTPRSDKFNAPGPRSVRVKASKARNTSGPRNLRFDPKNLKQGFLKQKFKASSLL